VVKVTKGKGFYSHSLPPVAGKKTQTPVSVCEVSDHPVQDQSAPTKKSPVLRSGLFYENTIWKWKLIISL